jgi:hypothetical protein
VKASRGWYEAGSGAAVAVNKEAPT